ncbi:hypothetical protein [Sphingobium sp. ZW T5_29]|uniref:ImuA family protein n=1 Tax=Sphingobium sp. ZW T5_29 TaxID=3378077 RepID=UPI003854A9B5
MSLPLSLPDRPSAEQLASLRAELSRANETRGPALPFGIGAMDDRLADHGLDGTGLHEIAAATASLNDDAAATLFAAGIAARFANSHGRTVLWALSQFDLYAPGIEQVGLGPNCILYAHGSKDSQVLAMAEDGLRDGSLACVIAEVKAADMTATRRLQLAASDVLRRNPLGIYVDAIDWSRELDTAPTSTAARAPTVRVPLDPSLGAQPSNLQETNP